MSGKWATAWSMAHCGGSVIAPKTSGKTVRTTVGINISGEKIRLRMSNVMGINDVKIASAYVHTEKSDSYPVLFSGSKEITIAPEQHIISDPIDMKVNAGDDITILMYYPDSERPVSGSLTAVGEHSVKGDFTDKNEFILEKYKPPLMTRMSQTKVTEFMTVFAGIDVFTNDEVSVTAAFGDSLTGMGLWTSPLKKRLYKQYPNSSVLLNQGINGNRLLKDTNVKMFKNMYGLAGLKRLDWDILNLSGVDTVILEIGLNDIFLPGSAGMFSPKLDELCTYEELVKGYSEVISKCKKNGIRVIGCTLTPCGGVKTLNEQTEELRKNINQWMLENKEYYHVLDFAKWIADPFEASRMLGEYDSGDHVHPNKEGGEHLSENIDLGLLIK